MSKTNSTLATWQRLSSKPGGKFVFSQLVCWKAPYFSSIRPRFVELKPGYSKVTMRKRRSVQNHIGTVHAIAICNLAEIAAGTMTDASVPQSLRWIPKGMTVEYLRRAETSLTAVATIEALSGFNPETELPVEVTVTDVSNQVVFRAVISMWLSEKKVKAPSS